jgi:hypothetical protein
MRGRKQLKSEQWIKTESLPQQSVLEDAFTTQLIDIEDVFLQASQKEAAKL